MQKTAAQFVTQNIKNTHIYTHNSMQATQWREV